MSRKKLALILIVFIIAGCQSGNDSLPTKASPSVIASPTMTTTPPPTQTINPSIFYVSPTVTPTLRYTPTATPTFTSTPLPTSILNKHGLDIPIGDYYKFVIHKTKGGERLEEFAKQYNTTVAAILASNYHLTNPTWSDVLFVIPIGISDVEKLPVFVVYQIKEEERGISTDSLAQKLRVNPIDLKYYNGMTAAGDRPLVGDLILVPWPKTVDRVRFDEPGRWDK